MYLGNQPTTGENNNFKILDDILSYTETFNGSSASVVSVADDTLTFLSHRFITGQRVTYSTTGTAIGGLVISTAYFVIKNDQNTIKLASTFANANNNVAINLTALGTGTTHTLIVAFDSINTKFKASFDNGTKALITRAAQLQISINGVIQQPQDTTSPTNGFGIDLDGVIIFSTAPANTDIFWGNVFANNFATFDISDNTVDSFTGNGSLVNFTLSKIPANNQNLLVTIDGVVQYPSDNTTIRAYGLSENILTFVGAPGNATAIQVRHIGFAGATSSSVTGFYGRTGNVGLTTADTVSIGAATIGTGGIGTSLLVQGNARITGILTVGTGSITLDGSTNIINVGTGVTLSSSGINVTGIITATSIVVSAGTTSAPSISPSGDSNTGIFFPAADTISASTGGTSRITIDSSGNINIDNGTVFVDAVNNRVGIGTSLPSQLLTTVGNIKIAGAQASNIAKLCLTRTDTSWSINNETDLRFYYGNGDTDSPSTLPVVFTSTGRVGIGTTGPVNKFTTDITAPTSSYDGITLVRGGSATSVGLYFAGSSYSYGTGLASGDAWLYSSTQPISIMADGASSTIKFSTGGNSERVRIDSSGRILVGTATARSNVYLGVSNITPQNQVETLVSNYSGGLCLTNNSTSGYSPILTFGQSYSASIGGNGLTPNNEPLGIINFTGNDGTNFRTAATIEARVDGTSGAGDMPGRLVFSTTPDGGSSPTISPPAMTIKSSQEVLIGTSTITANGGILQLKSGITFPATAVAATDANTLDDYEEGTFTPTLTFGGGDTGIAYSYRFGQYTKVGNLVTVTIRIALASKGSSTGNALIESLPFTVSSATSSQLHAGCAIQVTNLAVGVITTVYAIALSSTSTISFRKYSAGSITVLADTDFGATSDIVITSTYRV